VVVTSPFHKASLETEASRVEVSTVPATECLDGTLTDVGGMDLVPDVQLGQGLLASTCIGGEAFT